MTKIRSRDSRMIQDRRGQSGGSSSSEAEQILCGATIDAQEYWLEQFPQSFNGLEYPITQTVFFSGFTNTGCGQASSAAGPFSCPADRLVDFDLDFLAQLQSRFDAEGDLAAQYIVAHEYGHHVQNALGLNAEMHRLQQATQGRMSPESRTHGSSDQRVRWFNVGSQTGDPNRCDTFGELERAIAAGGGSQDL